MNAVDRSRTRLAFLGGVDKIRHMAGKYRLLQWNMEEHPGLFWMFPDLTSPSDQEKDPSKTEGFILNLHQEVIYVTPDGAVDTLTNPGVYKMEARDRIPGVQIIWVNAKGEQKIPWGVSDALTEDFVRVGAHGYMHVTVANPLKFYQTLIAGKKSFQASDLEQWVKAHVSSVMSQVIPQYSTLDLERNREAFAIAARSKCTEAFSNWGLDIAILDVMSMKYPEGFKFPEEHERTFSIQSAAKKSKAQDELVDQPTRASFLSSLKKPLHQYRVLTVFIRGNIGVDSIIGELMSRLEPGCVPILLLGPTAPTQLSLPKEAKVGWVTTVSGVSEIEYSILSPEDPVKVDIFLEKTLRNLSDNVSPVILGDFLDNMIPHMDESSFHMRYSELASRARVSKHTVVFVVKADIHSELNINAMKSFADAIVEIRDRDERGRLVREVRVDNRVDDIHTDWEKY